MFVSDPIAGEKVESAEGGRSDEPRSGQGKRMRREQSGEISHAYRRKGTVR